MLNTLDKRLYSPYLSSTSKCQSTYISMVYFEDNATYTKIELDSCKDIFLSRCSIDKNDAFLTEIEIIGFMQRILVDALY